MPQHKEAAGVIDTLRAAGGPAFANALIQTGATAVAGGLLYGGGQLVGSLTGRINKSRAYRAMLKEHPELSDSPRIQRAFDTLWRFSPNTAQDPLVSGTFVKRVAEYGGLIDPSQVKQLVDIERTVGAPTPTFLEKMPEQFGKAFGDIIGKELEPSPKWKTEDQRMQAQKQDLEGRKHQLDLQRFQSSTSQSQSEIANKQREITNKEREVENKERDLRQRQREFLIGRKDERSKQQLQRDAQELQHLKLDLEGLQHNFSRDVAIMKSMAQIPGSNIQDDPADYTLGATPHTEMLLKATHRWQKKASDELHHMRLLRARRAHAR